MARAHKRSLSHLLLVHEVAFLFLVAVTGLLSGTSAYLWQKTSTASVRINNSIYLSEQLRGELYRQLQEVSRARWSGDDNALEVYYEYSRRIGRHFNQLRSASVTRNEDEVIQALQQAYRKIQIDIYNIFNEPRKTDRGTRLDILDFRNAEAMFNEFEEKYLDLKALYTKQLRELEQTIELWTRYAPILIPVLFLLAVVIVIFTSRIIRNSFVRPMATIMAGAMEISRGDLTHQIPEQGVNEVAELAGSINRMAGELKTSRDALVEHERQAALGGLIPVVAHNIRNPLASIRAAAQVLDDVDNEAELREGKQAIVDTIDRLGRWVNALVSYLHPLKPVFREIRVVALLDAALELLKGKISEKGMIVKREYQGLSISLKVDPDLMEQAVYGLMANAIDASPDGAELLITASEGKETVTIGIRDYGSGLPFRPEPGNLEPGPSTKRFGTGLGIPIAFKICQSHGWNLTFEVVDSSGTLVKITAPKNRSD